MGFALDLETSIAIVCAIGVVLIFCLAAFALSEVFGMEASSRCSASPSPGYSVARRSGHPIAFTTAERDTEDRSHCPAMAAAPRGSGKSPDPHWAVDQRRSIRNGDGWSGGAVRDRARLRHSIEGHPLPVGRAVDRNGTSPHGCGPHGKASRCRFRRSLSGGHRSDGAGAALGPADQRSDNRSRP